MMLFGVWAASLALGFVLLRFEDAAAPRDLARRRAAADPVFPLLHRVAALHGRGGWRRRPRCSAAPRPRPRGRSRSPRSGPAALAFGLYYVNWAWPFLIAVAAAHRRRVAAAGAAADTWSRLSLQPRQARRTRSAPRSCRASAWAACCSRGARPRRARVLLLCLGLRPGARGRARPLLQLPAQAPLLRDGAGGGGRRDPARTDGRARAGGPAGRRALCLAARASACGWRSTSPSGGFPSRARPRASTRRPRRTPSSRSAPWPSGCRWRSGRPRRPPRGAASTATATLGSPISRRPSRWTRRTR